MPFINPAPNGQFEISISFEGRPTTTFRADHVHLDDNVVKIEGLR